MQKGPRCQFALVHLVEGGNCSWSAELVLLNVDLIPLWVALLQESRMGGLVVPFKGSSWLRWWSIRNSIRRLSLPWLSSYLH